MSRWFPAAFILAVPFVFVRSSAAQDPLPARQFTAGVFPQIAIPTDVDGDGVLDLLVPNKASNFLSFLKGNGQGSFAPAVNIALPGSNAVTAATADLDGDGIRDLVVGASTVLYILPGLGAGAFGPGALIGAGGSVVSLALADLNADSKPDVIVASSSGSIAIHYGNGLGGFLAPIITSYGFQPQAHASLAVREINGDGIPDLAITNYTAGLTSVAYGTGLGFGARVDYPVPANPWAVAVGDLNGDGFPELVTACRAPSNVVAVQYNNTVGGFFPATPWPAGTDPRGVALGDVDGDGNTDIFTASFGFYDGGVSVLLGSGPLLTFGAPTTYAAGNQPFFVAAIDLDGNGRADAVAVNTQQYAVTVLRDDGAGGLAASGSTPAGDGPRVASLADFDRDGRLDVATSNSSTYSISTQLGNGLNTFGAPTSVPFSGPPQGMLTADLNGDSKLDLAVPVSSPARVSLFFGDGLGGFGPPQQLPMPSAARHVAIGDLNADGVPDLVIALSTAGAVGVSLGLGNGLYQIPVSYPAGATTNFVAVVDVDGNGKADVIAGNDGDVTVMLGNGTGALGALVPVPVAGLTTSLAVGDVNGDNLPDVAQTRTGSADVAFFLNLGAGLLAAPTLHTAGSIPASRPVWVVIADLDQDGKEDLASANGYTNDCNLSIFRGDGTGSFAPAANYGLRSSPASIALGDTDRDGDLDGVLPLEPIDRFAMAVNLRTDPVGISSYGMGTHGCSGVVGLSTTSMPNVGNTNFGIAATNLPGSSTGLLLLADAQDTGGTDFFGINLVIHVDPFLSTVYQGYTILADAAGQSILLGSVPNIPALAGLTFYAQAVGLENPSAGQTCAKQSFSLVSSEGMAITVQP